MASEEFYELIAECREIHERKSYDYASNDNPFSNFIHASVIANESINAVFKVLIGIKIARLDNLLKNDKVVMNESIEDSFIDLANYCLLWGAYHRARNNQAKDHD